MDIRKEAPWIVIVEYPMTYYPNYDDKVDANAGGTGKDIKQCWAARRDETRILKYSYQDLWRAMEIADRISRLKRVTHVDVYDVRQGP